MGNEIRATLRINGDPTGALATVQTVTAQARAMGAEAIQINQKVSAFAQQNINDVKARITTLQGELTRLRGVRAALPASTSISNQVKVDNQILRTAQALSKAELDLAKAQSSRITMTAKTNDQLNKQINSSNNMVAAFARVKKAMQEVTQAASALNQAGQHMGATLNMIPSAGSKLSHVGAILANLVTMGGKTAAVFGNLGIAMGKLGAGGIQGLQKVGGMFSKLVSGADQAKKKMEQVGYGLISSGTHLGDLAIRLQGAQVAVYGLGGALTRMGATGKQAIQDVIGVAADFQQKIVTLQAILGSAGANLAGPLRDLAISLSEKSPFAPGEVADVISELVKGGVQIKDVMGGAAEAVMNLSTATGQDLKQSIQSVISATNDWANQGLKATDAVNSMTKVANATASDVNQLAAGMKNAGAVAASMGVNFDNTIQMLGALSNAGLKGAEGGTALRYFLLNLVPSTNKQINMMKDLNLMTYDYAQALELASQKHIKLTGNQEVDMNRLYQQFAQTKKTFQQAIEDGDRGVSQFQQYLSAHGVVTSQFVDTATHQLKDASDILQIIYDKVYSKVGGGVEGTKLLSQLFGERGGSKAAATMMLAFQKNLDEYNNLKERIKTETGAQLEEDQKLLDKMDANLIKTIRNQLDGYGSATEIAKARTETFTGSLHFLQSSLDGLKIILGDSLLQPLAKFLHMLGDLVNKASDFFKLNPQVAEAAGKFLLFGTAAASVIGPLLVLVATLPYVITAFTAIIANMSMVVVGVTAVGVALSLLAGAAYVVAQSMNPQSPMFTAMNQLVSFLKGTVDSLKQIATEGFVNIMVPIMKAMEQGMATVVIPSFMKLTDAVLKLTPVLVNGFGKVLQGIILPALSAVGQAIKNYAVPAIIGFMNVIKTIAPGIVNGLVNGFKTLQSAVGPVLKGAFDGLLNTLQTRVFPFLIQLGNWLGTFIPKVAAQFAQAIRNSQPALNSLGSTFKNLIDFALRFAAAIVQMLNHMQQSGAFYSMMKFAIDNVGLALSGIIGLIILSKLTWIANITQMVGAVVVWGATTTATIIRVAAGMALWTVKIIANTAATLINAGVQALLAIGAGVLSGSVAFLAAVYGGATLASGLLTLATTALSVIMAILDTETIVPLIAIVAALILGFYALKAVIDNNIGGIHDYINNGLDMLRGAFDGLKQQVTQFIGDTNVQFDEFTKNSAMAGGNAGRAFSGAWEDEGYETRVKLHNDMQDFQNQLDAVVKPAGNAGHNIGLSWIENIVGAINRGMPTLSEQLNQIIDAMNAVQMDFEETANMGIYAAQMGDANGTPLNAQQRALARQAMRFRQPNMRRVALSGVGGVGGDYLPTGIPVTSTGGDPTGPANSPYDTNTAYPGASGGGSAKDPKKPKEPKDPKAELKTKAQAAAEIVKQVADAIKAGFDAMKEIVSFTVPSNLQAKVDEFSKAAAVVVMGFQKIAQQFTDKALEHTGNFAETVGKVMSSIKSGEEAFAGLKDFKPVTAAQLQPVMTAIKLSVTMLNQISLSFSDESMAHLGVFAESAQKAVELISKATESFAKLDDFVAPVPDQIRKVVDAINMVLTILTPLAKSWAPDALEVAGTFAESAGKVMDALGKAVDFLSKLQSMEVSLEGASANAARVAQYTFDISRQFAQLVASGGIDKTLMDEAGQFADNSGKVMDSLGKGVDFINKVNDPKMDLTDVSGKIRSIVDQSMLGMQYLSKLVLDLPGQPAWVAKNAEQVGGYADNVGKVMDALGKAADFFSHLSDPKFKLNQVSQVVQNIAAMSIEAMQYMSQLWLNEPKWSVDNANKVGEFADNTGKVIDSLAKAADFFDRLRTLRIDTGAVVGKVQQLVRACVDIMQMIGPMSSSWTEFALNQTGLFADASGKVVDAVSKALTLMESLRTARFSPEGASEKIDQLTHVMVTILQKLAPIVSSWDEFAMTQAGTFADNAGKVVDGITKALELLQKLGDNPRLGNTSQVQSLTDNLVQMFLMYQGSLARAGEIISQDNVDLSTEIASLADNQSKVVGAIGSVLDVVIKLGEGLKTKANPSAVFAQVLTYLVDFANQFKQVQGILGTLLDTDSAEIATTVGNAMSGLANSFDFFAKLADFKGASQTKVSSFLEAVRQTIEKLKTGLLNDIAPELLDLAKEFGEKTGPVWDSLSKALDLFMNLMGTNKTDENGRVTVEGGLPALDPNRIGMFTAGVKLVIDKLKDGLLNQIAPELLDTMNEFGTKVGPAIDILSKTLGIFLGIQGDGKDNVGLKPIDPDAIGALVGGLYILLHHWRNVVIGGEFQGDFAERSAAFGVMVADVLTTIERVIELAKNIGGVEKDTGAITKLPETIKSIMAAIHEALGTELPQAKQGFSNAYGDIAAETAAQGDGNKADTIQYHWSNKQEGLLWKMWKAVEGKGGFRVVMRLAFKGVFDDLDNLMMERLPSIVSTWTAAMNTMKEATIAAIDAIKSALANVTSGSIAVSVTYSGPGGPGVPGLASGGIVMKPTLLLAGEGGEPEAIVPLSQLKRMTNNNTTNSSSQAVTNNTINIRNLTTRSVTDVKEMQKRKRVIEDPFS